ncbi:MAG: ATP-binding protein [Prevotella sp.]|nr:ATP-binding protein [Prevotella sp.]
MNYELILQNDVQQVTRLAPFVDEVCQAAALDMATTLKLNLAIEEAVVNVINYAYPHDTVADITIQAQLRKHQLQFVIRDSGIPFDPTAQQEADTTLSVEERPIGGLGIHLVRQIMDSVNYRRTGGKNILTLNKKLK